jgi:hypothetical protein
MHPTCAVNVYAYFIGKAIPNIITDWALLFLPIPYIWRLHQSRAQKVALCGVFGLGGLYVFVLTHSPYHSILALIKDQVANELLMRIANGFLNIASVCSQSSVSP